MKDFSIKICLILCLAVALVVLADGVAYGQSRSSFQHSPPRMPSAPTFPEHTFPETSFPSHDFSPTYEYSCSNCDNTVSKIATKCPHCGVRFDNAGSPSFGTSSSSWSPGTSRSSGASGGAVAVTIVLGLFGSCFLVLVAIVAGVVYFVVNSKPKRPRHAQVGNWQNPGGFPQRPPGPRQHF